MSLGIFTLTHVAHLILTRLEELDLTSNPALYMCCTNSMTTCMYADLDSASGKPVICSKVYRDYPKNSFVKY
jgi:hypothetical protein